MIARLIVGNLLCHLVVTNLVVVILLVVITGMFSGILLLSGYYSGYLMLIKHGFEADAAALIISCVLMLVTILCAILTLNFVRNLKFALLPVPTIPYVRHVRRITNAFVDGFTESSYKEEHSKK